MNKATHYLVLDRDDLEVVAWFPMSEPTAKAQAEGLAQDTGNRVVTGNWTGNQFAVDGPQGLKDMLPLGGRS